MQTNEIQTIGTKFGKKKEVLTVFYDSPTI